MSKKFRKITLKNLSSYLCNISHPLIYLPGILLENECFLSISFAFLYLFTLSDLSFISYNILSSNCIYYNINMVYFNLFISHNLYLLSHFYTWIFKYHSIISCNNTSGNLEYFYSGNWTLGVYSTICYNCISSCLFPFLL